MSAVQIFLLVIAGVLMFRIGPLPSADMLRIDWKGETVHRLKIPGMKLVSPDRYCPTCGRLLLHVNEDGSFEVADDITLSGSATASMEQDEEGTINLPLPEEGLVGEAICLTCHPGEADGSNVSISMGMRPWPL